MVPKFHLWTCTFSRTTEEVELTHRAESITGLESLMLLLDRGFFHLLAVWTWTQSPYLWNERLLETNSLGCCDEWVVQHEIISTLPWLVWLSGLSTRLRSKGSLVWFPVRAHTWVVGQVLSWGHVGGIHTFMFPSAFLPLSLKVNK